jgi:hypothetical protein
MKTRKDNVSLWLIKLFLTIVLIAAVISIAYKAFLLVQNRSFKFSTYNIMIIGKNADVLGFNTRTQDIQILEYKDAREDFMRLNTLTASIKSGAPLDGMIISVIPKNFQVEDKFPTLGQTISFLFEDEKYVFHNVNKFDLAKLYLVSLLTDWERQKAETPQGKFYDTDIFNEKTSIEIVNSTKINGLGARVSAVLSNMGANVISLKDGEETKTQIFAKDKDKKTLRRIEGIFELAAQKSENPEIADIIINLGKDRKWE